MEDTLLKTLAKYKYTRDIAPVYLQSFEVQNLIDLKMSLTFIKRLNMRKLFNYMTLKLRNQPTSLNLVKLKLMLI